MTLETNHRPSRHGGEDGFTLLELLVVMVILGLLAAIAIPSFFNQRNKANDAHAKASVRTAQTAIETYATDNDGSYLGATAAELENIEKTLVGSNLEEPTDLAGGTYSVTVTSSTGTAFTIARDVTGATFHTCDDPGNAGCPASGEWAGS